MVPTAMKATVPAIMAVSEVVTSAQRPSVVERAATAARARNRADRSS